MQRKNVALTKITRPKLSEVTLRERLFLSLDTARQRPIIWVSAPAGSGKTTLAASYLDSRKLSRIWYQVDAGDGDIASFFYYLGLAAKKAAPRFKKSLPLLTSEYLQGIPVFTRRFFEELFERLKPPAVIVFDNYQDVPKESGFHQMFAHALETVPEKITIVVLSRTDPPPQFVRFRANNMIHLFGWEDIRFTLDESRGLLEAQGRQGVTDHALATLQAKTEGWAAGLILLLAGAATAMVADQNVDLLPAGGGVFDYFANEIFDRADSRTQYFLLVTAFLTSITVPAAEQLTGIKEARAILEELYKRHYFTQKHALVEPTYQYHALFREFLLTRAKDYFDAGEQVSLKRKAAELLQAAGRAEDAIALLIDTQDWQALIRCIPDAAGPLVAQGRGKILAEWIMNIPGETRDASAWLLYWLAVARAPFDPAAAQIAYERSYELFSHDDPAGAYLSWCGIVETIGNSWRDLKPLAGWIAEFETLHARFPQFPTPQIEARTTCAMFVALLYGQPQQSELEMWAERAADVMRTTKDPVLSALIGYNLIMYHNWISNSLSGVRPIIDWLRRLAASAETTPLARLLIYFSVCSHNMVTGRFGAVVETAEQALTIEAQSGVAVMRDRFRTWSVWSLTATGELESARVVLDELSVSYNPHAQLNVALYQAAGSYLALNLDQYGQARDLALLALSVVERTGLLPGIVHMHALAAHAYCGLEKYDEARKHVERIKRIVRETGVHTYAADSFAALAEALIARSHSDRERAVTGVRHCIETLEKRGMYSAPIPRRKDFVWCCTVALECGIREEFVREVIRRNRLFPDGESLIYDNWPHPVKIYTLGRFEIFKDGKPLVFSGKVQKKPLELLKAIIAFGGVDVPEDWVSEALWPDADGDLAHKSVENNVGRLRKLLGEDKAVVLRDGKLSIDPRYCWTDARAFEQVVETAESARRKAEGGVNRKEVDLNTLEKTINLYRGHFLDGEDGLAWAVSCRESLKSKHLNILCFLADTCGREGLIEKAMELYRRGIEIDSLAEEFSRGLMLCYINLGREAEAVKEYRRCRKALADGLGVEPSSATQAIFDRLTNHRK